MDETERDIIGLNGSFQVSFGGAWKQNSTLSFYCVNLIISRPSFRYFFSSVLCWFVETPCTGIHRCLIFSCLLTDYNQAATKELLNLRDGRIRVNPVY